jgi:predicted acyl esterase
VPTEVTGPIEVVLWVAPSADTDFTAKLIDVYPCEASTSGPSSTRSRIGVSMTYGAGRAASGVSATLIVG